VKNAKLTPANTPARTTHKIWWNCPNGHDWQATPMMRARYGCPVCNARESFVIEYDGNYKEEEEQI
jgi:hypothetical protein